MDATERAQKSANSRTWNNDWTAAINALNQRARLVRGERNERRRQAERAALRQELSHVVAMTTELLEEGQNDSTGE